MWQRPVSTAESNRRVCPLVVRLRCSFYNFTLWIVSVASNCVNRRVINYINTADIFIAYFISKKLTLQFAKQWKLSIKNWHIEFKVNASRKTKKFVFQLQYSEKFPEFYLFTSLTFVLLITVFTCLFVVFISLALWRSPARSLSQKLHWVVLWHRAK